MYQVWILDSIFQKFSLIAKSANLIETQALSSLLSKKNLGKGLSKSMNGTLHTIGTDWFSSFDTDCFFFLHFSKTKSIISKIWSYYFCFRIGGASSTKGPRTREDCGRETGGPQLGAWQKQKSQRISGYSGRANGWIHWAFAMLARHKLAILPLFLTANFAKILAHLQSWERMVSGKHLPNPMSIARSN